MAIGILIVPSLEIVLSRIGNVIVTATTLYFVVHGKLQMLKHYKKRIMNRSGAEGLCGSTKRENCAEYKIVTDVHDEP